ncbi:hypothetical protein G9A89_000039 [Geosiphon pyriformis]|nr:hypothetical protein G9A89_000039 [Geosiphon pyriformis]
MPEYNRLNYPMDDFFTDDPDAFQNQYQELALIQEEQKQWLADLNTKLCDYCLISYHFQYCDECDLMFNSSPRILHPITKLPELEEEEELLIKNIGRRNVMVNFTEEDSNQVELIYTDIIISIPSYQQYIFKVDQRIQNQALIFKTNPEICLLANITNLYLFTPKEINKLNLGNLSTLQQMQLKILLNQYINVFASENEFRCTDIVKHQIDTGDAQSIKQ